VGGSVSPEQEHKKSLGQHGQHGQHTEQHDPKNRRRVFFTSAHVGMAADSSSDWKAGRFKPVTGTHSMLLKKYGNFSNSKIRYTTELRSELFFF